MTPAEFRQARKRLGLSQEALAHAMGLSWASIQRKEAGSRPIEQRDVLALEALERRACK